MVFQFTIDKYLNPYIPRSIVPRLPSYIGRWLGKHHKFTNKPKPDYLLWLDILIATFCGLLTIEGIFKHSKVFLEHHSPILIASYAATAILLFNVNQAPLAQPRNIFLGHLLSAIVGVCLLKLFELSDTGKNHLYIGAALSTAITSVLMTIFNCVHPPSGATALIPLLDSNIAKTGWWYIPANLVTSVVIIGVGLITNNILRSYPVYFWTAYTKPTKEVEDKEKNLEPKDTIGSLNAASTVTRDFEGVEIELTKDSVDQIIITVDKIILPQGLDLTDEEYLALDALKLKLSTLRE